jgi:hypothetical protein
MKQKETIYIDVDDEITAVIYKVKSSKAKLVVLVLPKRANVFQSVVNLKLLKNKALKEEKNLVLVTSDSSLYSLAGAVGIRVAKNLQDKPVIPEVKTEDKSIPKNDSEIVSGDDSLVEDKITDAEPIDENKPKSIGELAAMSTINLSNATEDEEVIEFDNDAKPMSSKDKNAAIDKKLKRKDTKIDKKLKVPDFGKFQKILLFGGLGIIVLIVLYVFGFMILPKAKVTIQSTTSTLTNTIALSLDSTQTVLDTTNDVVPANLQTIQKTITSNSVTTTGTKQVGIYANGYISVTNPSPSAIDIPQGTIFTEQNSGLTYQSTVDTTADACPASDLQYQGGGVYKCVAPPQKVYVTATQYGLNYDIVANDFTTSASGLSGDYPGTMSGATTPSTVQIVAQADIDAAIKQVIEPTKATIEQQLEQQITAAGFTPLPQTFVEVTPTITPSNVLGTQTKSITASGTYNYTMYGAHTSDLDTLVTNYIDKLSTFNSNQQSVLDSGALTAKYTIEKSTATAISVSVQTSSLIGPKFSISSLQSESKGKSSSYVISNISSLPGVQSVTIKYSPFWVTAMPHDAKKITIVIKKADGSNI